MRRTFTLVALSPAGDGHADAQRLPVPPGVSRLSMRSRPGPAVLVPDHAASEAGRGRPRRGVQVEPIEVDGEAMLVAVAAGRGAAIRVNGLLRAQVACLRAGDLFETLGAGAAGLTAEVDLAVESVPGLPPDEVVGRGCPYCTTPVKADQRIWFCPGCGTALHAEIGDSTEAFRCLDLCSACPACNRDIPRDGAADGEGRP